MFSFKKPKRSVRARRVSTSSEEEAAPSESAVVRRGTEVSKKVGLSFDGEDEGEEVFQVKKSSTSRRIIKQQKKKKTDKVDPGSPERRKASSSPKEQPSSPLPPPPLPPSPPPPPESSWMLSGREAEALHLEEEDDDDDAHSDNNNDDDEDHTIKKILQKGAIPDAAAIHAARKAREAARLRGEVTPANGGPASSSQGKDQEFIPLSDKRANCGGSSRLVRDDEHDDDGQNERVAFNGLKSSSSQRLLDRQKLQEEYEDEDQGAEEDRWEEQQIRKVVKNSAVQLVHTLDMNLDEGESPAASVGNSLLDAARESSINAPKPLKSYNMEGIRSRLKDRLESLEEVQRRHTLDMDKAVDDLIESQSEIKRIEKKMPELAQRHQFFQELRGYVNDLVECFNEKLINIKYLEEKMNKSKLEILTKVMERRRQDVRDQMSELNAGKKGNQSGAADNGGPEEDSMRVRRAAEREGRRRRRREQRNKVLGFKHVHEDGLSSDDELPSLDTANISKVRKEVESQARTILSDVIEEFSTLGGISERLKAWKEEDFDSYNDAYVSICLPKIFSPLVRLQLLFWNPLTEHINIEEMEWFKALAVYSYRHGEDIESLQKDPDKRLIPSLVEKVLIPKASGLIKASYDPTSSHQTSRAVAFMNKLYCDYPTVTGDSKQIRQLLTTVKEKIQSSVDNDIYIPMGYSKTQLETSSNGHSQFFHRQFWSCFKLFKNILLWHEILSDSILIELSISSILNRYILIALGINPDPVDTLEKCRQVVGAIPSELLRSLKASSSQELKRFAAFLAGLPNAKKGLDGSNIMEINKLLKGLQLKEEAETFKRTHKL